MAEAGEPHEEERNWFANYLPSVRGRIVGMDEAGLNQTEIQAALGYNKKTVKLWIDKFRAGGHQALSDHRKNNKRPLKTTGEEDVRLCQAAENHPFMTIAAALNETGIDISVSTFRRRLKSVGLSAHRPKKKTPLTEEHRRQQVLFAEEHLGWTPDQWAPIIWSDEKVFRSQK
ncbi:uncharacterized protein [Venturia canescens]|uniref:uncharacterized protein n=1 Tax=Venturia canescens TaxID=32260 RepID=UPI001C9C33E5|nr:uncharacterized protein LOC122416736 [Venturia canescens]